MPAAHTAAASTALSSAALLQIQQYSGDIRYGFFFILVSAPRPPCLCGPPRTHAAPSPPRLHTPPALQGSILVAWAGTYALDLPTGQAAAKAFVTSGVAGGAAASASGGDAAGAAGDKPSFVGLGAGGSGGAEADTTSLMSPPAQLLRGGGEEADSGPLLLVQAPPSLEEGPGSPRMASYGACSP